MYKFSYSWAGEFDENGNSLLLLTLNLIVNGNTYYASFDVKKDSSVIELMDVVKVGVNALLDNIEELQKAK